MRLGQGPLNGRIEDREPHGRETIYHLTRPLGSLRALEPGATARFALGDHVSFAIDETLVFDARSGRRISGAALEVHH